MQMMKIADTISTHFPTGPKEGQEIHIIVVPDDYTGTSLYHELLINAHIMLKDKSEDVEQNDTVGIMYSE